MHLSFLAKTAALFAFIVFQSFIINGSYAQEPSGGEGGFEKSPRAEEFDKEALIRLKKLPPDKVEELDAKLAEALTLLYDREYARALPIFREISATVETMDVLFWTASAAAGAGESDAAAEKLRQMLEVDPNLHRVRLELATVYFGLGRYEDARAELRKVLEAKPPEPVKKNIQKMLAAIDERTKRFFTALRGSIGIQYDSNVSAGPDNEFIVIPQGGGTLGPLANTQKSVGDWAWIGTAFGTGTYDFGEKGSWMWNTTGSFYQSLNFQYHQFDYTQMRAATGPWLVGSRSVLKLPFGYTDNVFEHDHLFDSYDFTPSYEYFFTPKISLQGTFSYIRETYSFSAVNADDKSGQNSIDRAWELNPNFYFNDRKDILSFYVSHENVNTRDRVFTFDALNVAVGYLKLFNWLYGDMELYGRYKYTKRDYSEPALLWPFDRKDDRHNFFVVLSRNISKNLFASLSYNLIKDDSNTELYDFDKHVWGLNVGFKF